MITMVLATVGAFVVCFGVIGIAYLLTGGVDLTIPAAAFIIAVSYILAVGSFLLILWLGGEA